MSDTSYNFELPANHRSIIKVIGVGGGGSNAVNHMYNQGIKDVEFVICNTDAQALTSSPVPTRLQIGLNLTQGLGAGANPEVGRNAAIESKDEIRELLGDNTKMVFVTAGMGGGTGTGAAPVIAKIAKEMDILTVGIITAPFAFEGKKKMKQAQEGLDSLKESCDTVIVILNDKLREVYGNLPITQAFAEADNVLTTAAKGIAEIITVPGYVNVDFQDVNTVMKDSGAAVMGSAITEGENRARRAAEAAISSPLLNNKNIHGAEKILLSIVSGEEAELQMDELTEITEFIQEIAGEDAEVIFGHGVDPDLGNSLRVTLIATGFDNALQGTKVDDERRVFDLETNKQIDLFNKTKQTEAPPKVIEPLNEDHNERGYSFEKVEDTEDENSNEDIDADHVMLGLDDSFEVVDTPNQKMSLDDQEPDTFIPSHRQEMSNAHSIDIIQKKHKLQMQSMERVKRLAGGQSNNLDSGDFKEKLEVPAYIRKKISLNKTPHSSERNISKFNLNDDNELMGNNRFLHDNVD